ncbi:ABC transporter ATP-binding protein [Rhodococcus sp. X156]|uniref:ABC transporter ATP-binding protein n=1 Tax=Rhodococcus sp. X156 TaxID=2499145 RepID=UPI000FD89EA8|nr:ABC transporter ATP-binding protein [Rhodococcus sp. X156]
MSGTLLPIASGREAWRLARGLLTQRRAALVACLLAFAAGGLAGLVGPVQLGRIVDLVSSGGTSGQLSVAVAWIAGAGVATGVTTWLSSLLLARVAEPALAELREEALDRALRLDSATLEEAGSGDLLSRIGDDVRLVADSLTTAIPLLVTSVVAIVFTAGGLFTLDWRLGLAGLAILPFYALGLRWYLPRSGPYYRRERVANGERAEAFLTGMHASRTLRAFGIAEAHQQKVDAASWRSVQISVDVYRLLTRFGARTNRSELIGLLLVLGTGFVLVRGGWGTVGAATAAALFFHRLFNPIAAVIMLFDQVQSAGASLTRVVGLAQLPPPAVRAGLLAPADSTVTVHQLGHSYTPGRAVLADVTLTVPAGQRVAVVGATGAGKTTLGAAVAGRLQPTSGEIRVGGVPLAQVQPVDGRPTVALVSQEVHVFTGTLRDNLTLAAPAAGDEQVSAALAEVGATGWVAALPSGLDAVVGDGAAVLTPAQAQQVALARVVLADPLVVVLDEATAEAGSVGARDLEQAALAATRGRTSLTIAHRLTQAVSADQVVVLDDGRVVETGTHAELVEAGGPYAILWKAWSGT